MKEKLNSLRHFEKKHFNSLSHIGKQERFNSLSQKERLQLFESSWKEVQKKRFNSMSQVIFLEKKKVQFRESYKKKFNTLSHIREKSWILWVVLENFNSLSRIKKNSMSKKKKSFSEKKSILWVVLKKISSVSRIRTSKKFHFESHSEKKGINSLSLFFFLEKYLSLWVFKKVKFFEFFLREKVFESCYKEGFNSSSHIEKNLSVILKRSSVLCIVFFEKSSILWVVFLINSKIQFFESHSKKNNSLSHAQEISILWVMLKKFQFFESFFRKKKKGSVLPVTLKKFNSLSYIHRRFNSLSQKKVQLLLRRGS